MKLKKTIWLSSATLTLLSAGLISTEDVDANEWQARTVEEVMQDVSSGDDSKSSYTIKWGDTVSVISSALNVDMKTLAEINNIADIDLIYAGNELTATHGDGTENIQVKGENGEEREYQASTDASGNTAVEEVQPNTEEQVNQAPAPSPSQATEEEIVEEETTSQETVSESETQTSESQVQEEPVVPEETTTSENESEATFADETSQETSEIETTSEEPVEEPVSEETSETPAPSQESVSEEPSETQATSQEPVTLNELPDRVEKTVEEDNEITEEDTFTESNDIEPTIEAPRRSYARAGSVNPGNEGLRPEVATFKEKVSSFYGVTEFSTYRPGDTGDHGKGLAVDFMVPVGSAKGDQIADFAINEMVSQNENIDYVIWEQRIYSSWTGPNGEFMEDRGSMTANHYDHVHVSFTE